MKNKIKIFVAVLITIIEITGMASATIQTYYLTNSNVVQLNDVKVEVSIDDAAKTISVRLVQPFPSSPLVGNPLGIDQFYYNIAGNPIVSVSEPGWNTNFNGKQASGFGDFESRTSLNPAGTGGIFPSSQIKFTLTNAPPLSITPNDHGSTVAVHVRFKNGCTGFVSDGIVPQGSMKTCEQQIPEFPTIALPIAAIIGLLFMFQHRKNKEE